VNKPNTGMDSAGAGRSRLDALVDTIVDGVIVIDAKGLVLTFNPACEKLFGFRADEVVGRNVKMLMPPPYHSEHDGYIGNYHRTHQRKIIGIGREVVGRRKDGSTFPMYLSVGEAKFGGDTNFVGIIQDLTARKQAEATRAHLAAIVESTSDGVIGKDLNGLITSWNKGAERMYGYTAAEVIGQPIAMLAPAERRHEIQSLIERVRSGGDVRQYQTVRITKDGRQLDISLTLSPIRDERGAIVGVSTIARDVTMLNEAERRIRELTAELVHTSRLSAMGQLSSSLAHELNQPLTAIVNYSEAARQMLQASPAPVSSRIPDLLEKAARQAERAGAIIRRLRSFVEKGTVERSMSDLGQIVAEATELATVGAKLDGVQIVYDFATGLAPLQLDRIQIQQVVVNLVRNAVEVLRDVDRRLITIRTAHADGAQEVAVIDSGPGIPPEIAQDLFKPFVTTKKQGMGIGLSISHSIIEAHGGRIWAEPNPDGGTAFRFRIPERSP